MAWLLLGLKLSCVVLVVVFGSAYAIVRLIGRQLDKEDDI